MLNNVENINFKQNIASKRPQKECGASLILTDTNLIGQIQADTITTTQQDNKKRKINS